MKTIVNINKKLGLGKDGGLLINIPGDMSYFRDCTLGATVIMGRKTLESFPGKRPLKGRINIVLTGNASLITAESLNAADEVFDLPRLTRTDAVRHLRGLAADNARGAAEGLKAKELNTVLVIVPGRKEVLELIGLIYPEERQDNVFVIGGASIYRLFLDDCDTLLITENDADFEADKFFPDFKASGNWQLAEKGEEYEYNGIRYSFNRYERVTG